MNPDTSGRLAVVEGREDLRVRVSVIGGQVIQGTQTEFGKLVKIQGPNKQIIPMMGPSQPGLDCCPNKHFFCGMAKKLGCQFCVKK